MFLRAPNLCLSLPEVRKQAKLQLLMAIWKVDSAEQAAAGRKRRMKADLTDQGCAAALKGKIGIKQRQMNPIPGNKTRNVQRRGSGVSLGRL